MPESKYTKDQWIVLIAWGLTVVTATLAIIAWGQGISWQFEGLSTYQLFPLFGLLAFSLMWAHYIMSAIRQYLGIEKQVLANYFEITSLAVLAAILLHPGLLWWQLWRDGFGLPPGSYLEHYVAPTLKGAVILGTISLFIFLAYELRRWFSGRSWWQFVVYATDVAILAIYYHGLKLGVQIQGGWFRAVWILYGITLVISLGYIYSQRFPDRSQKH